MTRRYKVAGTSAVLGLLLFVLYALSPIVTSYDSRWAIATAMSFLKGNAGDLTEYSPSLDYKIQICRDRPFSIFPIGTPVLAMPMVAIADVVDPDFEPTLRYTNPSRFEQRVASFYGALACVVFFWVLFSQFGRISIALPTTLIFAVCTSMWSSATRALWQQGPLVLMLGISMLLLIEARRRPNLVQYLGLSLAIAYVIRPTACVPIAVFSAYVLLYQREWFWRYLLWAGLIAVPWMAYNLYVCGTIIPIYYLPTDRFETSEFWWALLGTLFSPNRGWFIFSPVLLLGLSGAILAFRKREERPLNTAFCLVIVLHWLLISQFTQWWGGYSFGPRYMTDVLPFLCFFVAFNFEALLRQRFAGKFAVATCIALLAGVSLLINARGAFSKGPVEWNYIPVSVDVDPSRLWDWSDPQFLRRPNPRVRTPLPTAIAPTPLSETIAFNDQGQGRLFLGKGWSILEDWGIWSDGPEAALQLRLKKPERNMQLRLLANALEPKPGKKQVVTVLLQDHAVAILKLDHEPRWTNIVLPASAFSDGEKVYTLRFLIRHPTSPEQLGLSNDDRLLGMGLHQMVLDVP